MNSSPEPSQKESIEAQINERFQEWFASHDGVAMRLMLHRTNTSDIEIALRLTYFYGAIAGSEIFHLGLTEAASQRPSDEHQS